MASKKILLGECNEDLISQLPDHILCHILSFMPTKFSVCTSVLSTRWKQLFTFVPVLDFNYNIPDGTSSLSAKFGATSFINFVNSVFASYEVSRINKFRLTLSNHGWYLVFFPVASWVSSAIHRNVQEIDMTNLLGFPMTLPRDIFLCKTLVSLTLSGKFVLVLPQSACLPCLRTCELVSVKFNDESAKRLFRNCPALEKLTIDSCHMGEGIKVLDISAPALKKFLICEYKQKGYQIALNVPNLLSFNYLGSVSNEFSGLENLKSLVHAWIYYIPSSESRGNVVLELVRLICHVQHIQLYGEVEAFLCCGHPLPIFKNMTHLSLSLRFFACLSNLLDKSPRLESISFDHGFYNNGVDETISFLTEHVPICVSLHLKEVSLSFTGSVFQHKVIKYFLKYAQNLKMMKIQTKVSWNEQLEISSAACEIVLVPDWNEKVLDVSFL